MAPLSELEKALIIGFCAVGGALLLFLAAVIIFFAVRSRCGRELKRKPRNDSSSSQPAVSPSLKTSTSTPVSPTSTSTTSDNASHLSSPSFLPRVQQPQSADMTSPGSSLVFPSVHSKYAGMRVGRTAWTSAYMPPPRSPPQGGLERGAAALEERLDAYGGSENSRSRSSAGFEPIMEDAVAGQYIARAQAGEHRGTPPSERGSQTKLLGAAVEPAVYDDAAYRGGEAFRPSHPGRVLPRRSGYGPYSSSAVEAARRRTQDLYNARRAQQGAPTPSTDDAFPPPPPSVVGRQLIWSRTSGRPQTGSYVINPRGFDEGGLVSPSGTDYQQQPGGETSMYFPAEEASPGNGHSMVVEATIENQQPNSPDTPGERHLIGDAFRFLDEFEE